MKKTDRQNKTLTSDECCKLGYKKTFKNLNNSEA